MARRSRSSRMSAQLSLFEPGLRIRRDQAIAQIRLLVNTAVDHPDALRLICLFQITAEELAEAGLAYETLKALEKRGLFF